MPGRGWQAGVCRRASFRPTDRPAHTRRRRSASGWWRVPASELRCPHPDSNLHLACGADACVDPG